jgi:HAMP domain-containing protein
MDHATPHTRHTQYRRSRIAARSRTLNAILLVGILALMTAAATVIVTGVNHDVAKHRARAYAVEAATEFSSYISGDLVLVRKASLSKAVTSWFADEASPTKRLAAYDEMMDYIGLLQNAHVYFGIHAALNEYSIEGGATLADFVPFARLNPANPNDAWYFECIESENAYRVKIDIDKFTHKWLLWINHKVMANGKLAGVFCFGLPIPPLLHDMFAHHDIANVKGYVIDKHGRIQLDRSFSDLYGQENTRRIHEESADPWFATAMDAYLERIDGLFGPQARPEVVTLAAGSYGYASIAPIAGTNWSVVIFSNAPPLSGATHLLPLSLSLLSALLLYVAARNAISRRLIFTPLIRLTQSVSEAKAGAVDIFGNERDDEIGDLARAVQEMGERLKASSAELLHTSHERQRQARLLNAVNSTAAALLATADVDNFESALREGMEFMGRCVDVDRIQIWRNKMIDGALYHVHQYEWLNDAGRQGLPVYIGEKISYNEEPEWEAKFARGECVNGPIAGLAPQARELLLPYGVRSMLRIPVYVQERFWGIVNFNDCHKERTFTEDEVSLLRSVSLMMANAVNRYEQTIRTQERTKFMLEAIPLPCHLWDAHHNLFECNEENAKFFGVQDKQEFFDHFSAFSPEYQPDGRLSSEANAAYLKKAFAEGKCVFAWMHQKLDGTPLPAEITLVRVTYGNSHAVVSYVRDLRERTHDACR